MIVHINKWKFCTGDFVFWNYQGGWWIVRLKIHSFFLPRHNKRCSNDRTKQKTEFIHGQLFITKIRITGRTSFTVICTEKTGYKRMILALLYMNQSIFHNLAYQS